MEYAYIYTYICSNQYWKSYSKNLLHLSRASIWSLKLFWRWSSMQRCTAPFKRCSTAPGTRWRPWRRGSSRC